MLNFLLYWRNFKKRLLLKFGRVNDLSGAASRARVRIKDKFIVETNLLTINVILIKCRISVSICKIKKIDYFKNFLSIKKMEKLNSDEKISILMKLDGNEIVKVCQTSKEMSRICNDDRYTSLWRKKIEEEFHLIYDGQRGFDKYRELRILYNADIYSVIVTDVEGGEGPRSVLFYTLEDAKNYIWMMMEGEFNYMQVENALNANDYVRNGSYRYMIDSNKMNNLEMGMQTELEEQKKIAENKERHFYELIRKEFQENEDVDEGIIRENIIDSITDLNSDLEGRPAMIKLFNSLKKRVEMILTEGELPEKFRNIVTNYILDSILVDVEQRDTLEKLIAKNKK